MRIASFLSCLAMLAVVPSPARGQATATPRAVLTLAEQPLRLVRGAAVFKAAAGIAVQKDDILETGAAGAQIESGPNAIVALGPQTRVLVLDLPPNGKALELVLLQGWVKLMADKPARVATPALEVTLAAGATIVQSTAEGRDGVFAEEGTQQAARVDKGRAGVMLRLAAEQYAEVDPAKAQPVAGRPPRAFIAAMPPSFRDRLAKVPNLPNLLSAGKVAPVKEREADFADVAPWLAARLPGVKSFVPRFRPRLADPAFRKQLEHALGQQPDWRAALHPPVRRAATGSLF